MNYALSRLGSSPTRYVSPAPSELQLTTPVPQFISVDDSNYAGIPIGKSIDQVVHPLSDVRFTQSGQQQKVWSCEGDQVKVELQLRGVAPWSVEYKVVGQRQATTIKNIQSSPYAFDVTIPSKIAKNGGAFSLSLGMSPACAMLPC